MRIVHGLLVFSVSVGMFFGAQAEAGLRPLPKATIELPVVNPAQVKRQIYKSINQYRQSQGVGTLSMNSKLSKAAQAHAQDMFKKGYFDHQSPTGTSPLSRTKRVGYKGCLVAENLSYSWKTVDLAMDGWLKSPGHRFNLLHPDLEEIGVGIGPNNLFVTVFATPC